MLQLLTCFVFINASKLILKIKGQEVAAAGTRPAGSKTSGAGGAADVDAMTEYVSEATLQSLVPLVQSSINVLLCSAYDLIRCRDNTASLRAIGALLLLSVLGRIFDGVTCATLLLVAALSLPKLYLLNQAAVDSALLQLRAIAERVWLVVGTKVKDAGAAAAAKGASGNNKKKPE